MGTFCNIYRIKVNSGELRYKEISRILKLSESAVAVRINRGKERLRFKLEE